MNEFKITLEGITTHTHTLIIERKKEILFYLFI